MKKIIALLLICVMFSFNAFSQPQALVQQGAQQMANLAIKGDYPAALTYIYPKVVTLWGGRDYILKNSKMVMGKIQSSGFKVKGINVDKPGKIQVYGSREFSVINNTLTFNANGTTMNGHASLLAVSEDKGKKWYYIIAGTISNQALYKLFPEIEGKILLAKPQFPGFPAAG